MLKPIRKGSLLIFFFLTAHLAQAQFVNLSDTAFRNWIDVNYPGAIVGGQLDTTNSAVLNEQNLAPTVSGLKDLDGVKYFKSCTTIDIDNKGLIGLADLPASLKFLICDRNNISVLPDLPAGLESLICYGNQLQFLPTLGPSLKYLDCSTNQLDSLPSIPASLETLRANLSNLTSIPALPSGLKELICSYNAIIDLPPLPDSLEVLGCSQCQLDTLLPLPITLRELYCSLNNLKHLPSILPPALQTLSCSNNQLTELAAPIPSTLRYLTITSNQIDSIPSLPNGLLRLKCGHNLIRNLDPLPSDLRELVCNNNLLDSLPALPNLLRTLDCYINNLSSLPQLPQNLERLWCYANQLSCLPLLPNSMEELKYLGANMITCLPNYPKDIDISKSDSIYPLCDINSGCSAYPNISGKIYIDSTLNGLYDLGERLVCGTQLRIDPGNIGTGCSNGKWGYIIDQNAIHNIRASSNYSYFNIVPDSHTVTITTLNPFDTTLNFGIQPINTTSQDLRIDIISPQNAPRPGFNYQLSLHYLNPGTVVQNARVEINFNSTNVTYISSSTTPSMQNQGFLEFQLGNLYMLDEGFIDITFRIDSLTSLGTLLNFDATILPTAGDLTPMNNVASISETVIGSYDPNDKLVSDIEISPQDVLDEIYLQYTIRFQNTGTASAINVRLRDDLSSDLNWNSFEYMSASHDNIWELVNGMLTVRFNKIHLPDSNANEPESHGYFKFRVKVKNSLSVGDKIPNFADIYFDFNSPIRTDTVFTEVTITTDVEFPSKDLSIHAIPNPSDGSFTIELSEFRDAEINIYNTQGQLVHKLNQGASELLHFNLHEPKGIYFIEVSSVDQRRLGKLIIR